MNYRFLDDLCYLLINYSAWTHDLTGFIFGFYFSGFRDGANGPDLSELWKKFFSYVFFINFFVLLGKRWGCILGFKT